MIDSRSYAGRCRPVRSGRNCDAVIRLMSERVSAGRRSGGGAANTLVKHIPSKRQTDTANALIKFLTDRPKHYKLLERWVVLARRCGRHACACCGHIEERAAPEGAALSMA
jgi:hypothetical protein